MSGLGRRLLPMVMLLGLLLLSGCSVSGTVTVRPNTDLDVDLAFTDYASAGGCPSADYAQSFEGLSYAEDTANGVCHVTGTMTADSAAIVGVTSAHLGEYQVLAVSGGLFGYADGGNVNALNVEARFPGTVVEHTAALSADGDRVSVTLSGTDLRAVSLDHLGPSYPVLAAAGGAVAGIAAVTALALVVGRRRRHSAEGDSESGPSPLDSGMTPGPSSAVDPGQTAGPRSSDDPSLWAPPPEPEHPIPDQEP